ncbi:protein ECT2-like, partial [Saccoglossus kowalevskii]|uniref:Protein ECT2-like n=1 Tax=Saccoglossus kowalevskii TaxID=10224 RepID=A0ABM0M449_SACKO
ICKRRSKIVNTYRSPASLTVKALQKGYKHLELLSLSHIRRVLDINETEDCQNAFAILVRPIDGLDRTDRIYMFMLTGEDQNKSTWLKTLCKHMANTTCKADSENFLTQIDPQELEISKSDFDVGKFGRAIRVARKATKKVGRTFSFNKTPRRIVQRAKSVMSTSMSPLVMNNPTTSCRTVTPKRDEMMGARLASSSSLKYAYLVTELLLSPRKKKK